jgi:aerobic-type carbon monoxide dehydrogenase small subunit (CoxS/CutS family)
MRVALTINGSRYDVDVAPDRSLADVIRNEVGLTGTKIACGEGTCGTCTVLVDGRAVLGCLTLAVASDGCDVRTVEWHGEPLERLRAAFIAEDGFQCGFCTPGQLVSALALLEANPHPTRAEIREAMSGNLCRCGAYEGIERAVARAAG